MAEFDPDHLERLMVTAFQLLGKPVGQAQEFARAILKAAAQRNRHTPSADFYPDALDLSSLC
jgi:hypothetical protein